MVKKREKIALVILNFNGLPYVLECLQSLKQSTINNQQLTIIIVDNASTDESVREIQNLKCKMQKSNAKFKIVLIQNKKNLGFAGGNNVGIRYALKNQFDYIGLLNPDTIVEKKFLKPLLQLIKSDKKIGIVSPVLKGKKRNKTVYALGAEFNPILGRTKHIHLNKKPIKKAEQEMVSGCCMLIKREVFEEIGLLDERFFLYFEDSDFCLRARKAGYRIYVEPKSVIFHKTSLSLGGLSLKKIKYNLWSNFLFINKQVKPCFRPLSFVYLIFLGAKMIINWPVLKKEDDHCVILERQR